MEENKVEVASLAEALALYQITGDNESLNRWIIISDVNRPGLELAGFVMDDEKKRVVVLGNKELSYIETLDEETQKERFETITDGYTPCIIISSNRHCPQLLKETAKKKNFPIFSSMKKSSNLVVDIVGFLEANLAPSQQIHGCLVSVYGRGILICGESGIGKSEITLELIRKGHIMVADDAVIISRIQNQLTGKAPEVLYGMLEIRGIGVIDCIKMFGAASVIPEISVDYVIELVAWKENDSIARLNLDDQEYYEVLQVEVPKIVIPVREGRSMSTIIESAVINNHLKNMGFDSNKDFDQRVIDYITKRGE